jgi:transcriptional regulator with XRE-family HTH domain
MSSFFFRLSSDRIQGRMAIDFGRWLAKQRTQAGLTQKDVAARCQLSDPYITRLESGSIEPPPLKTCKALGRALGIGWEELWRRSFASRLKRWLKHEGYSAVPDAEILELVRKIESTRR